MNIDICMRDPCSHLTFFIYNCQNLLYIKKLMIFTKFFDLKNKDLVEQYKRDMIIQVFIHIIYFSSLRLCFNKTYIRNNPHLYGSKPGQSASMQVHPLPQVRGSVIMRCVSCTYFSVRAYCRERYVQNVA